MQSEIKTQGIIGVVKMFQTYYYTCAKSLSHERVYTIPSELLVKWK